MSYYVSTIPVQARPVTDVTPFHVPYVRDANSIAIDSLHDVRTAEDRARVQQLSRHDVLQSNRSSHLADLTAQNAVLDEQIKSQQARVQSAHEAAYSPNSLKLANPVDALHRPVYLATRMGS